MQNEFSEGQREYTEEKAADELRRAAVQERCTQEISALHRELAVNFPRELYNLEVFPQSIRLESASLKPEFDVDLKLIGWSVRIDEESYLPFLSSSSSNFAPEVLMRTLGKYCAATIEEKKKNLFSRQEYERKCKEEDRLKLIKSQKDEFWDNVASVTAAILYFGWFPILLIVLSTIGYLIN